MLEFPHGLFRHIVLFNLQDCEYQSVSVLKIQYGYRRIELTSSEQFVIQKDIQLHLTSGGQFLCPFDNKMSLQLYPKNAIFLA